MLSIQLVCQFGLSHSLTTQSLHYTSPGWCGPCSSLQPFLQQFTKMILRVTELTLDTIKLVDGNSQLETNLVPLGPRDSNLLQHLIQVIKTQTWSWKTFKIISISTTTLIDCLLTLGLSHHGQTQRCNDDRRATPLRFSHANIIKPEVT